MYQLRWFTLILLTSLLIAIDGCGKSSPPSAMTTAVKKTETGKDNKQNDNDDLEKIVAVGKQEGKLFISAEPSEPWRKALVEPFQKKYPGIKVELTGISGRDFRPKLLQERKVGQYLWDLRVAGISPDAYELKNTQGINDPIRPLLLPEIANDGKWIGGLDGIFADKEKKYFPIPLSVVQPIIFVNRDSIPESELITAKELLNPKYKGKIAIQYPNAGSGFSSLVVLLNTYGENFVRDLLTKQNIVITTNERQLTEWVIRGKYPIGLGIEPDLLLPFREQDVGLSVKPLSDLAYISARHIQLLNKAPHPNAAKLYLNWFLSREGQGEITKIVGFASRRTDVEPPNENMAIKPDATSLQVEEKLPTRERTLKLVKELVK